MRASSRSASQIVNDLDLKRSGDYPGTVPAYYRAPLKQFLGESDEAIVGQLAIANARAQFPLPAESIEAWQLQLPPLRSAISGLVAQFRGATQWHVLLEYPIPRVGKRIDAVILASTVVLAIETKTGHSPTSAVRQAEDYALNLACFHEGSHARKIVPVVVATAASGSSSSRTVYHSLIEPCVVSTPDGLFEALAQTLRLYLTAGAELDAVTWDEARFKPVPTIIEAAVALYFDMDVFEIGHASAARESLNATTDALTAAVHAAKVNISKTICFVTGVPGAGKTLVGLNAVHQAEIRESGAFLSGNGPLVKVIREALVRDVVKRRGITRLQAELEVHTFVHNVHKFADEYYRGEAKVPVQRVIVFDEAQRAWNALQNQRAKRPAVSEPEMMLEVMDRHPDWTVIIALVGGGQEINRGEAGLAEWGRALSRFPHWQVLASPQVLEGGNAVAGFRLFESNVPGNNVIRNKELHLPISTRSIRAEKVSDWANAVLDGFPDRAAEIATSFSERPALCRDLQKARVWLCTRRRGNTRAGLVGSASAARLRADGLEPSFDFHQRFDWDHWFLDDEESGDVRRSSQLEVFATQFEIQGLELDWICVCWGEDFLWNGTSWDYLRFTNREWRSQRNPEKQMFLRNGYRVLLTRARHGMLLYVPMPHRNDATRKSTQLDATAEFLIACGAVPLQTA